MRRTKAIWGSILLASILLSTGATCFPLLNPGDDPPGTADPTPSADLTVAIRFPSANREVPQGTIVRVDWNLFNGTGSDAVARVILRDRADLTNTVLEGGIRITGGGDQRTEFDTSEFGGRRFDIIVEVEAGDQLVTETAGGQVTVNALPEFTFTEPFEDVVLGEDAPEPDPNSTEPPPDPTVTIRWTGADVEGAGSVTIFGDTDTDHDSGNEFQITTANLGAVSDFGSFDWNGVPLDGPVEEDTVFNLFAEVSDPQNEAFRVEGLATITVPFEEEPEPDPTFTLEFSDPNEDADFLLGDATFTLGYTLDEDDDVLVDLGVDLDDNHMNGNEILIDFQRLVEVDTNEVSFDWDGNDKDGNFVSIGIYRAYLVLNRGAGTPTIVDAETLIFRRDEAEDPLIALTDPPVDTNRDIGAFQTIRWRDDDPEENATIRLTLDDDDIPNEGIETDGDEIEILADREASGDGVQDTFAYQVPNDLAPGNYFIFAYIDRDGLPPFDNISVSPGRLIVLDPDD